MPGELVDEVRRLDAPSVDKLFRTATLGGEQTWLWRENAAAADKELQLLLASVVALVAAIAESVAANDVVRSLPIHVPPPMCTLSPSRVIF